MKRSRSFTAAASSIDMHANAAVPSISIASVPTTPVALQRTLMPAAASTARSRNAWTSARTQAPAALPSTIDVRGSGVASRRWSWPTSRSQMTASPKKIAMNIAAWAMTPGARYAR